jgi:hypothetical protein
LPYNIYVEHEGQRREVRMIKRIILILSILILGNLVSKPLHSSATEVTTFFNQQWLKAVVSIEMINDKKEINPIGTGFLIQTDNNHILLVSVKHVISDENNQIKKALVYRINLQSGKSKIVSEEDLMKKGAGSWFLSKSTDIVVRFMYTYLKADILTIPQNMFLKDENVQPGTPSLILGFPMGLRSEDYATPILRNALVALKAPNYYMLDGFVFPGNSGSPVVYMPAHQIQGIVLNNYIDKQMLLGVISSYIPYSDTAISVQTKRPRITFEENSGLCIVIPSSEIIKLINSDDVKKFDNDFK